MKLPGFEHITKPVAITIIFAIALTGLVVNWLTEHPLGAQKTKPSAAIHQTK